MEIAIAAVVIIILVLVVIVSYCLDKKAARKISSMNREEWMRSEERMNFLREVEDRQDMTDEEIRKGWG